MHSLNLQLTVPEPSVPLPPATRTRQRPLFRRLHDSTPLTIPKILAWADAFYARNDRWPNVGSGRVAESPRNNWHAIDAALRTGGRGLRGGSSIAGLLAESRGMCDRRNPPELTVAEILRWADLFKARSGRWPHSASGPVADAVGESWARINRCLETGGRGLAGGSSLLRLLAESRGKRTRADNTPLTVTEILAWADAHHARVGRWPQRSSGPVAEAPGETWRRINYALATGTRGLPSGSSLARLLEQWRSKPDENDLMPLALPEIETWARAFLARTGTWPTPRSSPVLEAPGETWQKIDYALVKGRRGLPGGSSLARLRKELLVPHGLAILGSLSIPQILAWAEQYQSRTGAWPTTLSGGVPEAPGETWQYINHCLIRGRRGLPGGSSLRRLLETELFNLMSQDRSAPTRESAPGSAEMAVQAGRPD
jgi:hypothetical protein